MYSFLIQYVVIVRYGEEIHLSRIELDNEASIATLAYHVKPGHSL